MHVYMAANRQRSTGGITASRRDGQLNVGSPAAIGKAIEKNGKPNSKSLRRNEAHG